MHDIVDFSSVPRFGRFRSPQLTSDLNSLIFRDCGFNLFLCFAGKQRQINKFTQISHLNSKTIKKQVKGKGERNV